jgi:hypothetical protein
MSMITTLQTIRLVAFGLVIVMLAWSQVSSDPNLTTDRNISQEQKHEPGVGTEIGSGAGTIGTGVAKGAGNLAKGTAKGGVDLVTLHPLRAGGSVGKGVVIGGKDATVGTAKGTGKIAKGIGKAFKKLL